MEFNLPVGICNIIEMTVEENDTAAFHRSGLMKVFATPAMVAFMEDASQTAIQKYLPDGYITLGVEINVKHLRATPVGVKIFCESILTDIDGKKLMFEIKAWDEKALIGTATHVRYIAEAKSFMEKLGQQKLPK